MKVKYLTVIIIFVYMVTACSKKINENVPDILDAYDAVEKSNEMIEMTEQETIKQSTDSKETTAAMVKQSTDSKETTAPTVKQAGPPKIATSESTIVGMYDEVEYSGVRFKIEDVVKSTDLNVLYEIMDKESADAFYKQLTQGYRKDSFENGHIKDGWNEMFIVKCVMSNTTSNEKLISMKLPLYHYKGDNVDSLTTGENIDMSQFGPDGRLLDFYGEHTKYILNAGIETSDSYQNITLNPDETKEIYIAYDAATLYNPPETRYFLSTYFLGGNRNISLDLPKGTQLIPVEEYE